MPLSNCSKLKYLKYENVCVKMGNEKICQSPKQKSFRKETQELLESKLGLRPSWLRNYLIWKRFAVQTLLTSQELVIEINLNHNNSSISKLARNWSISSMKMLGLQWGTKKLGRDQNKDCLERKVQELLILLIACLHYLRK